ncbi:MAG: hypothetical protein ACJA2S_002317 [Cyclobacteriaceae bacterium]|jgi:hypothetical protein
MQFNIFDHFGNFLRKSIVLSRSLLNSKLVIFTKEFTIYYDQQRIFI